MLEPNDLEAIRKRWQERKPTVDATIQADQDFYWLIFEVDCLQKEVERERRQSHEFAAKAEKFLAENLRLEKALREASSVA